MSTIKKEKLVILDGHTVNPGDLPWDALEELTDLTVYERSQAEDVIARIGDASLLMTNKCRINKAVIDACPQLKYIGEMATGYNNIDIAYAREKNITVTNVPNYSSDAVAQLVLPCSWKSATMSVITPKGCDKAAGPLPPISLLGLSADRTARQDLRHLGLRYHWQKRRPHRPCFRHARPRPQPQSPVRQRGAGQLCPARTNASRSGCHFSARPPPRRVA